MAARIYRMTVASIWYDEDAQKVREFEMHFKVARFGEIKDVRSYLLTRGIEYFQNRIYYLYRQWVPKGKIRASFEREEPAKHSNDYIRIEIRRMEGVGEQRRWKAYGDMPRKISYYKKARR